MGATYSLALVGPETVAAVTATAKRAGGTLLVEATAMPIGTMATIRDPQGAVFSIPQPAS